ncbi:homeobox protein Hox-A9a isoform X5 [Ictalurus punctatus]|uniref:Homeobox protein Hox-A9a isoform X5 n=1 Tax=Ictalurus punctatus TaxID=7998 RepID=A0A979EGD4_ICTPU|nr:homeobox protein Hox-A9a isoform X5 [Ictalurus punctatus]
MSISGVLAGYYSFIAPESEESNFSSGSGLLLSSLPAESSVLEPCIFPSKQVVCGNTGWGHISEPRASAVNSVYHSHTEPESAQSGEVTQSWLMDLPVTEQSTVHHQYVKLEVLGTSYGDYVSSSRTVLAREHVKSGARSTDTDTLSIRTDEEGKNEEKRGIDPNNPVSNWLHASSTRKKRCPYSKHQILELEKEFLFNTYLTRDRRG